MRKILWVAVCALAVIATPRPSAGGGNLKDVQKRKIPGPPNGVDLVFVGTLVSYSCPTATPCPNCPHKKVPIIVKNVGNQPSTQQVTLQAFRQTQHLKTYTLPPLQPGQLKRVGYFVEKRDCCGVSHSYGGPPVPNFFVKLDTGNAVAEYDEGNNTDSFHMKHPEEGWFE